MAVLLWDAQQCDLRQPVSFTMPTSIFIAKLLGPVFALVGIALLRRPQAFRSILEDFLRSPALVYLAGFLGLLAGLAIVLTHNVWVFDWPVIITLIGWVTIVRAVITFVLPEQIGTLGSVVLKHRAIFTVAGIVNLLLGLALSYFGYST
jgi:uncharacterized membrane protein